MLLLLSGLTAAVQFLPSDDCIYDRLSTSDRRIVGEAVLAKQTRTVTDLMMEATNQCARENSWSVEQTVKLNGYASTRIAADHLAGKLGKPEWSSIALRVIRARPFDQVRNLASTGGGGVEFELVLAHMIGADPDLPEKLYSLDNADLESFVLMVKLVAVAEVSRIGG